MARQAILRPRWLRIPQIVAAAQKAYDAWTGTSGGGCCVDIAKAIYDLLPRQSLRVMVDYERIPPHTAVYVYHLGCGIKVDIDWHRYEIYLGPGAGDWAKIHGVVFRPEDVTTKALTPAELDLLVSARY